MSGVPTVKVIEAIKPANSGTGEVLRYDALIRDTASYDETSAARAAQFWDSEPDSLEESSAARQCALEFLLKTSVKVVESTERNHDLWADRFTKSSIEIYGQPDPDEAARLMAEEFSLWQDLKGSKDFSQTHLDFLIRNYEPILLDRPEAFDPDPNREKQKEAIKLYGQAVLEQYQPLFTMVDEANTRYFTPRQLKWLFDDQLTWMYLNDSTDWGDWKTLLSTGKNVSVDRFDRFFKIGKDREPATVKETKGLTGHELLIHALRCKNGYAFGDKLLATGMNGYLDVEEGLGILTEEGINGELPPRASRRYSDIALALGSLDGRQRSRDEIFQVSYAREMIRQQVTGDFKRTKLHELETESRGYTDRIYRGGRGESLGERQAIFTKDIAYHVGYKQMAAYITRQLASGKTAREVFDYLSLGKFDPENQQHVAHLDKVRSQAR
jgi:hypothetical protein